MLQYRDQLGKIITLGAQPRRIVSLVPSQTELLWDLGVRQELVGVTKFCIHPPDIKKRVAQVGGTKRLNLSKIDSLKPDLIIGNREENELEQIVALRKKFPVWMSDVTTLDDALNMISDVGRLCGRESEGKALRDDIARLLQEIRGIFPNKRVAYFIWKDPYMVAGNDTFIHSMLVHVGLVNVAASLTRYPELSLAQVRSLEPEVCLLSSEPYPFSEKHQAYIERELQGCKVMLVDGEMFSWYGSRLLKVGGYMKGLVSGFRG